jgi:anti-sigma factor RsiW
MSCGEWQREIASESESDGLADHLATCPDCQAYAREIEENRAALRSLEVDGPALEAVRRGVLAEIRSQRHARRRAWIAAAAACVAMVCAVSVLPSFKNPAPPRPVEFAKTPRLEHWTVAPPVRRTVRSARPHRRTLVANGQPLVVKMLTDDPDVIVIWLVDQKGDAL